MYKIRKDPINKYYSNANDVRAVVTHVDLGTRVGTINHLRQHAQASYHLYIPRNIEDEILEFVPAKHGAWHAGRINQPNARAKKIFANGAEKFDPNKMSFAICYEGKPVDANGNVTWDWSRVEDGERPTDSQVKRAVWAIKEYGFLGKPIVGHKEITSDKPEAENVFARLIEAAIDDETSEDEDSAPCSPDQFTVGQLISALLRKVRGSRS